MARKKKTWFSVIKRLFITDQPQSRLDNKKDKRRRWVFRLLKMKEVAGLSKSSPAREMLPWQTTQSKQQTQMSQDLAATKIQAAFRGYLARKALGALKGVVKLQALIRGWAVRQQAIKTLKCLQSLVNIQSQVFSKRSCERIKESMHDFCEKDINVDLNSQKRWDDSTLTKEEIKALFATKREGCVKRERVKEYYLNHRRSAETERDRVYGRRRYWLEQWVDSQLAKSDGPKKKLDTTLSSNARNREEINGRLRNFEKQYQAEMCETPTYVPRRSYHHRKQRSIGDEHSFTGSPSYMASTESAKARARSLSSPRLRPLSFDVSSETSSPYKHKLSPISSINSELTSSSWIGNHVSSSHRSSPCFKGLPGPVKSSMSSKELRIRGMHHQSGTS